MCCLNWNIMEYSISWNIIEYHTYDARTTPEETSVYSEVSLLFQTFFVANVAVHSAEMCFT